MVMGHVIRSAPHVTRQNPSHVIRSAPHVTRHNHSNVTRSSDIVKDCVITWSTVTCVGSVPCRGRYTLWQSFLYLLLILRFWTRHLLIWSMAPVFSQHSTLSNSDSELDSTFNLRIMMHCWVTTHREGQGRTMTGQWALSKFDVWLSNCLRSRTKYILKYVVVPNISLL